MNEDLKNKIQKAAFNMFRDWTKNAKIIHPEIDFTIIDETVLIKDLIHSIKLSVNTLKEEEEASKREIPGYDIGFIWGFIYANLNGHWVHEYIRKRSDDYKMLIALKSLRLYLDIENIALIKIDEIYKKMFIEDVNFENIHFRPDKKKISDFRPDMNINIESKRENNVAITLDNLIIEKVAKIITEKDIYFLPKTKKYFSEEDVKLIISEF